ncbi:MAG: LON peptidase substrate-binding domain-containing protein, partial [Rhodocyclaceae bacterium]|nr:LON peptidase substrate-binding domain-containing protein [Rhodocyclaceae bacterium]
MSDDTLPISTPPTFDLPLLPLRDVVVFPHMVIPLFVGRPKSIKGLELALETGKSVLLVTQKSATEEKPELGGLYSVGCIANVLQMLKLPDGTVKILVEGTQRAKIEQVTESKSVFLARITPIAPTERANHEIEALRRAILAQFDQYIKLNKKIPPEILASLSSIQESGRLTD